MKNKILGFGTSISETVSVDKGEEIKYKISQISRSSACSCLNVLKHVFILKIKIP